MPMEATSTLGETADDFTPLTTCFKRSASAVKFWAICTAPPKLTMAISRFGPALLSINLAAA